MKTIQLTIDEQIVETREGATVLEVAREQGIGIPTLCYHPALKPVGACRLCVVEVKSAIIEKSRTMRSCVLKANDGMQVKTFGEAVHTARLRAFRNLLHMAPQSRRILQLAHQYGIDLESPGDGCIRCRLCIRVCREIIGPGALQMEKRAGLDTVAPIKGLCIGCGTCANICPTEAIRLEDRDRFRIIRIRDEVIGRHPLEPCEGCGRLYASPKYLDHVQHRTEQHPDTKSHHRYCPTCSKMFSDRVKSQKAHPYKIQLTRKR